MLAACVSWPAASLAQSAQDKAAADVLFQQGKKLMQEGKLNEACPKLAESLRLDTGIGTMLWLADCYERSGKTASAWGQFQEAAETASRTKDSREKVARERAQKLESRLVKLQIMVPAAHEVPGLEIKRDGTVLGKPLWGTAVPVDPGGHNVTASAPGYATWEGSIEANGDGKVVAVPVPKLAEDTSAADAAAANAKKQPKGEPKPVDRGATQRWIGIGVAGAGVIGVAVGVIFGLSAKGKLDDSNADGHCQANNHCDAVGFQARNDAKDAATISTIGFIAGAALIGGGAAIYFTAPKGQPKAGLAVAPQIGAGAAGLRLSGSF